MKNPNIILFMTDQQRYDSIAALGSAVMQTPNLDRLAGDGVSFDNCFCTSPSCVPSRASFFNLCYPHDMGAFEEHGEWRSSWVSRLQAAGYHTVNVGKMHTLPFDAPCGFDQRFVVENKDRPLRLNRPHGNFYDEWDKFLNNSGVTKPSRHQYQALPEYDRALGAYTWPLEEHYHPDVFVGNMARWFIEQRQSQAPLFLQIGFPGPHPPYDPPARYVERYDPQAMPPPLGAEGEYPLQPPAQHRYRREMVEGNHDAIRWHDQPSAQQVARLRQYYAANVTLIDDQIGAIIEQLDRRGCLDDSIVLFTSDHGEALGDHGHIQKWTMYDPVVRVPLILRAPGRLQSGQRIDALLQQMDVVPLLFELAGVPLADSNAAVSAAPALDGKTIRDAVYCEHGTCRMLPDIERVTMLRTLGWKLVSYDNGDEGELYDLRADPSELHNRWHDGHYVEVKRDLLTRLHAWLTAE